MKDDIPPITYKDYSPFPHDKDLMAKSIPESKPEDKCETSQYIKVLPALGNKWTETEKDVGSVRLVDHMGSDLSVVRAARVSHDASWRAGEDEDKDEKLIRYLLKHDHSTPFEHVVFTFDVKAPIFVFRQWHRHRTQSYNELSGRYAVIPEEFYVPDPDAVGKDTEKNKQGRAITSAGVLIKNGIHEYRNSCRASFNTYKRLLDEGFPKEVARMVLPQSMYSKMFCTVDLWNLFHFLKLRLNPGAQWEIRQYAKALLTLIEPIVPVSVQAWRNIQDAN